MTKLTRFLIVAGILGSMAGGAYAAWVFRDRLGGGPPRETPAPTEYVEFVGRLGGDEPAVRDELNFLISTTSADLNADDRAKADRLTRECLDVRTLLDIGHVRAFIDAANAGRPDAYHFVGPDHRRRLVALVGERPTAERVLAARRALAKLGDEFGRIRQPPDWQVTVEGEKPPMPFLGLLESGPTFLPLGQHPEFRSDPRVPAFAAGDGELLAQLGHFFNAPQARAAFPPGKFPKLYAGGRIPPTPTNLTDYQKEIESAVGEEMHILLPADNPAPEAVEAVKDVYGKLQRFFTAVVQFEVK